MTKTYKRTSHDLIYVLYSDSFNIMKFIGFLDVYLNILQFFNYVYNVSIHFINQTNCLVNKSIQNLKKKLFI